MADFSALKTAIQANIRTNGNEEITGAILQDILLSMVTTMGDGAINALAEALAVEVQARLNAVSGEATTRAEADSQLSGRINAEAQTRGEADTQLNNSITAIITRLNEGYVYAGIATPSTNPGTPTGKVFYIALQAGTYTNFSSLAVTQGITILKYNGTAWSQEQLVAIDDVPEAGSNNLVKSGGVYASYMGKIDITTPSDKLLELPFFYNKKVLFMLDQSTPSNQAILDGYTDKVRFISGQYYLVDFSTFNEPRIYNSANNDSTLFFSANEDDILKFINNKKVYNVKSSLAAADLGDFYVDDSKTNIKVKADANSGYNVFPTRSSVLNVANMIVPTGNDVIIIDGRINRWNGTTFVDVLDVDNVVEELFPGYTATQYGYIDQNGAPQNIGQESTHTYIYKTFIPVEKGNVITYHGGWNDTYDAFNPIWGYDANKQNPVALGQLFNGSEQEYSITITSDTVKYIKFWGYTGYNPNVIVDRVSSHLPTTSKKIYDIIVASDGSGDYTSLYDAIRDTYGAGHKSIYIKAGSYEMPKASIEDYANNRNLTIIGESKESVIIYNNEGEYDTTEGVRTDCTPLRMSGNVTLRNLTIISRSTDYQGSGHPSTYCVHIDFNAPDGSVMEIDNCRMYNDHYACIGIGLRAGFTLKIRNCELYSNSIEYYAQSTWNGAVICHDGSTVGNAQKIELVNNIVECSGKYAVSLFPAYNNQIDALFIGNAIFSNTDGNSPIYKGSPVIISSKSCNNNISMP